MKRYTQILVFVSLTTPLFVRAEDAISVTKRLLGSIGEIIALALPIVFSLAILAFFWGIFLYVFTQTIESKVEGKKVILWSLVAIFVMASLFGIITLFQNTLNVGGRADFDVPKIGGGVNSSGGPGKCHTGLFGIEVCDI